MQFSLTQMVPYIVTILVLIFVSTRKTEKIEALAALGLSLFQRRKIEKRQQKSFGY